LPQLAILYIVYLAFAQSILSGVMKLVLVEQMLAALVGVCLLLFMVSWAIWRSSACLKLSHAQRIAAFFTASQKSIATGLPLLSTVFAAASLPVDVAAIVLIPLLMYHPLQLLLGGILVQRFAASSSSAPSAQS
jgi:sodium/bile acid cotransporter 7